MPGPRCAGVQEWTNMNSLVTHTSTSSGKRSNFSRKLKPQQLLQRRKSDYNTSFILLILYVTETLMAPLQYEKHTVSATALFDFDKSVLKEQGQAELHNLAAVASWQYAAL